MRDAGNVFRSHMRHETKIDQPSVSPGLGHQCSAEDILAHILSCCGPRMQPAHRRLRGHTHSHRIGSDRIRSLHNLNSKLAPDSGFFIVALPLSRNAMAKERPKIPATMLISDCLAGQRHFISGPTSNDGNRFWGCHI